LYITSISDNKMYMIKYFVIRDRCYIQQTIIQEPNIYQHNFGDFGGLCYFDYNPRIEMGE